MEKSKYKDEFFPIGASVIEAGIKLEEQLTDLLKVQIKALRSKTTGKDFDIDFIEKTNAYTKTIIMALMMADEQIRRGLELCEKSKQQKES
ncbi:hypothetical protein PRVXH_000923 [Proteinivorax hydrogeniformans]|uniref:Uncharacterized protein n=1 Tax=Proteinivorax hydrogeniformans TaxID=1826727 RepID=A0AAU8HW66_9FIRM